MEFFLSPLFKAQITRNAAVEGGEGEGEEEEPAGHYIAARGVNASEIWNLTVMHI